MFGMELYVVKSNNAASQSFPFCRRSAGKSVLRKVEEVPVNDTVYDDILKLTNTFC
jgi:hypothetical protein